MTPPSTRNLSAMPSPAALERLLRSAAVLDAILSPEWDARYYSFNQEWDPALGYRMGSMRNGSGDDYFALFTAAGTAIKGYAHEYPMANPGSPPAGIFDGFPAALEHFLDEPAFTIEDTTFCLWCLPGGAWSIGPVAFPADHDDPDGSAFLLELLSGEPAAYQTYAQEYFEVPAPLEVIEHVYAHRPLTDAVVRALDPEATLRRLADDLAEIGYPYPGE